jgi:hypothetical protein
LQPKLLEAPEEWTSDDWKFVYFYAFEGCLAHKTAAEACEIVTRSLAKLPRTRENGGGFLEELEKAGELAVKPLRDVLEQGGDVAMRVAMFDLLKKLDPSAPVKLSGMSDEAYTLVLRVEELVQDSKTWRSKTAELFRDEKIETLREAHAKAQERATGSWVTVAALALGVARYEIGAGKPLSHDGKAGILVDLDAWGDDEIETTRDLLASLDDTQREQLLAGSISTAKNGNERKRCMQLAYMAPATLPAVIEVIDAITIGKYDTYKKTEALRCLVAFGPSVAKTLARDLESRSTVGAEIVANVLGEIADPATAHALVELLGHSPRRSRRRSRSSKASSTRTSPMTSRTRASRRSASRPARSKSRSSSFASARI